MRKYLHGLSLVALMALMGQSAFAVPTLRFVLNGVTQDLNGAAAGTDCADGDACDSAGVAGVVTFNGPSGPFIVNVTTGISKPVFTQPEMDLNSVNISVTGPATLELFFSDDNFTKGSPQFNLAFGGTIAGVGSSVSAAAYYDLSNALFGTANLINTLGPFTPGAFAGSAVGPGTLATPFSLTQYIKIVAGNNGVTFSGDFHLTPVPEPDTVALLIGVVLLSASVIRRKYNPAA